MQVQKHIGMLGMKAVDKVTGYRGVVSSICFDLYGCVQAVVTPVAGKDGKKEKGHWFDVRRLLVTGKKRVMPLPNYDLGYVAEGRKGAAEKPPLP